MPDSTPPPETEHFEINEAAYRRLVAGAAAEVIRCLLATESPTDLTMKKVRARARVFAACSTEPWTRVIGVIQPRADVPSSVPASALEKEYYRLLRALRDRLLSTLLRKEREVWEKARRRMINRAEHAVFRVTESAVHLHRLTPNKKFQHHG